LNRSRAGTRLPSACRPLPTLRKAAPASHRASREDPAPHAEDQGPGPDHSHRAPRDRVPVGCVAPLARLWRRRSRRGRRHWL